jgi:F-type H+-transporting ATPase subunit b
MSGFRYCKSLVVLAPVLLAGVAQAEEAGHAHEGSFPAFGELGFWTLFVFAGLLAVLAKFAWKPLIDALESREQHVRTELAEAAAAHEKAKTLLAQHEKILEGAQTEIRALMDEARRDAQHARDDIVKQAQTEAQSTRDRAVRDIEQAKDKALQELFAKVADVATDLAGQIVHRSLNPQDHRDLVAQVIKDLPSRN